MSSPSGPAPDPTTEGFDPADPPVPELEVDEDVAPRPEEEIADAARDTP
ncbi:hypothetical protein ACFFKU_17200 [Kineococcus gynurae]|uniref:Uncharacterized protein n=1 Tax=Kineococcus gynurae TaxID=452979 RepID=A0ABV5LNX7_9ACTN